GVCPRDQPPCDRQGERGQVALVGGALGRRRGVDRRLERGPGALLVVERLPRQPRHTPERGDLVDDRRAASPRLRVPLEGKRRLRDHVGVALVLVEREALLEGKAAV